MKARNPEFLRNLWLEISPHRLIATPVILGLTFYLFDSWKGLDGIQSISMTLFLIVAVGWGSLQASESVLGELKGGTWMLQRLTAMDPWPMTWGKLCGSTAFAWYVGAWCLAAFVLAALSGEGLSSGAMLFDGKLTLAVLYLVGAALLFQVMSLVSSLVNASWFRPQSRRYSRAMFLLLILIGIPFVNLFTRATGASAVQWWEMTFAVKYFWLVSLYLFIAWGLAGCYMLMRKQLQIANSPTVWIAFVLFLIVYADGFVRHDDLAYGATTVTALRIGLAMVICIIASYAMVFWERTSVVDIQRLLRRLEFGGYAEILREVPRWALTAGLAFTFGTALLVYLAFLGDARPFGPGPNLHAVTVAALGFMARDLGLILYFHFSEKSERAGLTAVIYLGILYYLCPALARVLDLEALVPWFLPVGESVLEGGVPAFVQAALMWLAVAHQWRHRTDIAARPPAVANG